STGVVTPARAALVRKGGHAVGSAEHLELLVAGPAPLSSLPMIGVRTGLAGSASSAGRTGTVQATSWLVCSLDRLTPTRWQQACGVRPPGIDGVTGGTSSATIGLSSCPDCCSKEVPDEHGMWVGSAPRPDHLRRVGTG